MAPLRLQLLSGPHPAPPVMFTVTICMIRFLSTNVFVFCSSSSLFFLFFNHLLFLSWPFFAFQEFCLKMSIVYNSCIVFLAVYLGITIYTLNFLFHLHLILFHCNNWVHSLQLSLSFMIRLLYIFHPHIIFKFCKTIP